MRKLKYRLTEADLQRIIDATRVIPLVVLQCGMPPPSTQERVSVVWRELGREHGFDPNTVEPDGDMVYDFRAAPVAWELK